VPREAGERESAARGAPLPDLSLANQDREDLPALLIDNSHPMIAPSRDSLRESIV
jgi:hypothetical protein